MPKTNEIAFTLERVSESAHALAIHGAGGYSVDTSALDAVFVRCLLALRNALMNEEDYSNVEYFDPRGEIYETIETIG